VNINTATLHSWAVAPSQHALDHVQRRGLCAVSPREHSAHRTDVHAIGTREYSAQPFGTPRGVALERAPLQSPRSVVHASNLHILNNGYAQLLGTPRGVAPERAQLQSPHSAQRSPRSIIHASDSQIFNNGYGASEHEEPDGKVESGVVSRKSSISWIQFHYSSSVKDSGAVDRVVTSEPHDPVAMSFHARFEADLCHHLRITPEAVVIEHLSQWEGQKISLVVSFLASELSPATTSEEICRKLVSIALSANFRPSGSLLQHLEKGRMMVEPGGTRKVRLYMNTTLASLDSGPENSQEDCFPSTESNIFASQSTHSGAISNGSLWTTTDTQQTRALDSFASQPLAESSSGQDSEDWTTAVASLKAGLMALRKDVRDLNATPLPGHAGLRDVMRLSLNGIFSSDDEVNQEISSRSPSRSSRASSSAFSSSPFVDQLVQGTRESEHSEQEPNKGAHERQQQHRSASILTSYDTDRSCRKPDISVTESRGHNLFVIGSPKSRARPKSGHEKLPGAISEVRGRPGLTAAASITPLPEDRNPYDATCSSMIMDTNSTNQESSRVESKREKMEEKSTQSGKRSVEPRVLPVVRSTSSSRSMSRSISPTSSVSSLQGMLDFDAPGPAAVYSQELQARLSLYARAPKADAEPEGSKSSMPDSPPLISKALLALHADSPWAKRANDEDGHAQLKTIENRLKETTAPQKNMSVRFEPPGRPPLSKLARTVPTDARASSVPPAQYQGYAANAGVIKTENQSTPRFYGKPGVSSVYDQTGSPMFSKSFEECTPNYGKGSTPMSTGQSFRARHLDFDKSWEIRNMQRMQTETFENRTQAKEMRQGGGVREKYSLGLQETLVQSPTRYGMGVTNSGHDKILSSAEGGQSSTSYMRQSSTNVVPTLPLGSLQRHGIGSENGATSHSGNNLSSWSHGGSQQDRSFPGSREQTPRSSVATTSNASTPRTVPRTPTRASIGAESASKVNGMDKNVRFEHIERRRTGLEGRGLHAETFEYREAPSMGGSRQTPDNRHGVARRDLSASPYYSVAGIQGNRRNESQRPHYICVGMQGNWAGTVMGGAQQGWHHHLPHARPNGALLK
jgi:hypothetical protein